MDLCTQGGGRGGEVFCVCWGVVRAVQTLERAWSGVSGVHAVWGFLCVFVFVWRKV